MSKNKFIETVLKVKEKHENKRAIDLTFENIAPLDSILIDKEPSTSTTVKFDIENEKHINELIENDTKIVEISRDINADLSSTVYSEKLNQHYGKVKKSFLLALKSSLNNDFLLLWKDDKIDVFLQLHVSYELNEQNLTELCDLTKNFIKKSLEENHLGLAANLIKDDKWKYVKLDLTQLNDPRGYNLLMFSAEVNAINLIEHLLTFGFTINDRVKAILSADVAWENKNYELLAILLNNNSRLPSDFENYTGNGEELPQSLKDFLFLSKDFYEAIDAENEEKLKEIIVKNQHLRHFYNASNLSAPTFVLLRKNFHLYEFFTVNNISFGVLEPTSKIIEQLTSSDREKLQKIHLQYRKVLPQQHISALIANTNLGHDIDKLEEKRNYVEKAYYQLNSIEKIEIILQCVAAAKKFNILFDFNRKHVQFLDPTVEAGSDGLFDHRVGRLSIGAKKMSDSSTENEVHGTIAHELCHYVMYLVYNNNCKPYHKGDKSSEKKFEKISMLCYKRSKREELINAVYSLYDDFVWHAELIVRVPHLTALYHDHDPARLEQVRKIYKPLFDYYEEKVIKDMKEALPTIGQREEVKKKKRKKENWILRGSLALLLIFAISGLVYFLQPQPTYEWNDLSDSERKEIIESEFNYQGQVMKINDIVRDTSIFSKIKSDRIRDYFLFGKRIQIGKEVVNENKFFIPRIFKNTNGTQDFESLRFGIENKTLNTFILSDEAGTGKTATFKNLTSELKKIFPNKWITYVPLRETIQNSQMPHDDDICENIGREILNLNNFNFSIFNQSCHNDDIIFLFDGFDEVASYEDSVLSLFKVIKNNTKNVQFISTRPLYKQKIEEKLETKTFEFIPYTNNDRDEFVIAFAEQKKFTIRQALKSQSYLEKYVRQIESSKSSLNMNNPLMLKIFMETAKKRFSNESGKTSVNFYSLYDELMKNKRQTYNDKVTNKSDQLLCDEVVESAHQILALNTLLNTTGIVDIQTNEVSKISSLDIMCNINKTSIERLSDVEIIEIIPNSVTHKNEFKFGHETYADYFLARYLIEKFYKPNGSHLTEKEINLRLKLLFFVLNNENFNIVHQLIDDYFSEVKNFDQLPSEVYLDAIEKNFKHIFDFHLLRDQSFDFIKRVSNFFKYDSKTLKSLWRFYDNETFIVWYFKEVGHSTLEVFNIAEKYFTDLSIDEMKQLKFGKNQKGTIQLTLYYRRNENKIATMCIIYQRFHDFYCAHFENWNLFDALKVYDEDDEREMLMSNSFRIMDLLYSYDLNSNGERIKRRFDEINETLGSENMSKFLFGIDWKTNDTILHRILENHTNGLALDDFLDKIKNFFTRDDKKKLIYWQNRLNETPLMLASKYQNIANIRKLWQFVEIELNEETKNILIQKDANDIPPLFLSILNKNEKSFSYVESLYDYNLKPDEMRKYLNESVKGSLLFLFKESSIVDRNYLFLTEYFERIFDNRPNDLKYILGGDETVEDILIVLSRSSTISPKLINLLTNDSTTNQNLKISTDQQDQINDALKDYVMSRGEKYVKTFLKLDANTFFLRSLNILNDNQRDFFVNFLKSSIFYETFTNVLNSKECAGKRIGTNCFSYLGLQSNKCKNPICSQLKSVYTLFETSLNKTFKSLPKSERVKEIFQYQALRKSISSDEIRSYIPKSDYSLNNLNSVIQLLAPQSFSFIHSIHRDFLTAQYFVENLYNNNKVYSVRLSEQMKMMTYIWSKECNCKMISNLITNYIQNNDDDNNIPFNADLKQIIESEYSDLLLKVEITMIETVSRFFEKDKEILRKLWRIDEKESILYLLIMNDRLDEFTFFKSIAKKFFDSSEMEKFDYISYSKGKLLYHAWNKPELTNFDLENILLKLNSGVSVENLKKINNSVEFLDLFNFTLSNDDQKELINVASNQIFFQDIFKLDSGKFENFWLNTINVLGVEGVNDILSKREVETNAKILHNIVKIDNLEYFNLFLSKITQNMNPSQYFDLLMSRDIKGNTPLMKLIDYSINYDGQNYSVEYGTDDERLVCDEDDELDSNENEDSDDNLEITTVSFDDDEQTTMKSLSKIRRKRSELPVRTVDESEDSNVIDVKSKYVFLKAFWNITEDILTNATERKEILRIKNNVNDTLLQKSMNYASKNVKVFDYVSNLYLKHFDVSEIRKIIMHEKRDNLKGYISSEKFSSIVKFLGEIFKDEKKKFLRYLKCREDALTIFAKREEEVKSCQAYKENLDKLSKLLKDDFEFDGQELPLIQSKCEYVKPQPIFSSYDSYDGPINPDLLKSLLG